MTNLFLLIFLMNHLPFAAIKYASSNLPDGSSKSSAKALANCLLKKTRTECGILYLKTCHRNHIVPNFIDNWFRHLPPTRKPATRKLKSLKRELLREAIDQQKQRLTHINRDIGFEYLHVTRRCPEEFVHNFLDLLLRMVRAEERLLFQRHGKKWTSLTHCEFPADLYHLTYAPQFPFSHVDVYWCTSSSDRGATAPSYTSAKFINETSTVMPQLVTELLEKGPNFRLPHNLDNKFMDGIELALEVLTYKLRWFFVAQKNSWTTSYNSPIPFQKNSVKLPPKMPFEKEKDLMLLKQQIMCAAKEEIDNVSKNKNFRKIKKQVALTKQFFKDNNLSAVPSDKTQKLVVVDSNNYTERGRKILADTETYQPIPKSRQHIISNQANKIMKSLGKAFPRNDLSKLLTTGSSPATFYCFIKDHKEPNEDGYPLRPIASVNNTATQKVDWLVSKIISQLIEFVPSNIKNAEELTSKLTTLDPDLLTENHCFVSLDAIKLYPSIPISFGILAVMELAETHWHEIDNYGTSTTELEKALKFISYNYEIEFDNNVYLQKKGCPMGAHFAPPFAIITLHKIETEALKLITIKYDKPKIYARYIDDIFLGPVERNTVFFNDLLKSFNAVNDAIQFTIEVPEVGKPLNFLDLAIYIKKQEVKYTWYSKECHSNITLKPDSWLPRHVKTNFVTNRVRQIALKCSDDKMQSAAFKKLKQRFRTNGYKNVNFQKIIRHKNKTPELNNFVLLQTGFINDRFNNKIHKILKHYDLPIKNISKPHYKISQCLGPIKKKEKHANCDICNRLPENNYCYERFVVYKITCKHCNNFYIGETCRPFHQRFNEHRRSLQSRDQKSALSDHVIEAHSDLADVTPDDFLFTYLAKFRTPVETRISEARFIDLLQPSLNRRIEKAQW